MGAPCHWVWPIAGLRLDDQDYEGWTDNGSCHIARLLAEARRWLGLAHIRTSPYTPRNYGKVERFIQTLTRVGSCLAISIIDDHGR